MIGEKRAPSISSGPVIVTDNWKDTGCFSFLWVHNSFQAECTWARPSIFTACHLYKVLTPMRRRSFTLQEFFIKNGGGGVISESAGMSSCVDWLISKHQCDASQTCRKWRGSASFPDTLTSLHQSSSHPGAGRNCPCSANKKWYYTVYLLSESDYQKYFTVKTVLFLLRM